MISFNGTHANQWVIWLRQKRYSPQIAKEVITCLFKAVKNGETTFDQIGTSEEELRGLWSKYQSRKKETKTLSSTIV